jgi:hypothetical protein
MQSCSFVCCVYGYEPWSLKLRDEDKLRVFENRVLSKLFGSKTEEVAGNGEDCILRSFMSSTLHQILSG